MDPSGKGPRKCFKANVDLFAISLDKMPDIDCLSSIEYFDIHQKHITRR